MKYKVLILFVPFIVFLSCNSKPYFEHKYLFKNNVWQRFNFVFFNVPVKKGEILDFSLIVKHLKSFPSSSLPLNITFTTSDGEMRSRDYLFTLKNSHGQWISKKIDSVYQKTFNVHKMLKFETNGICKVRIEQKIPVLQTKGIKSIILIAKKSSGQK